ncbi:chromosome segregation protein SMC, partial [Lacticaseibacillus rhamnosus]|uniref:chromosome segregation protein SMC n=1 Tax=Lacticaseibacillus rhamnosus TaxID=47715 RepID=UPI0034A4A947
VIVELKHQVEPLREQASLAKDYQQQSADYHRIHQTLLALEIEQLAAEQEKTQGEAKVTKATIAALTAKVKDLEHQSEQLSAVDHQYEEQLNHLNDQVLSRSMKLENLSGEANLSSERSANAATTLADLKERLAHTQQSLTEANQRLADLAKQAKTAQAKQLELKTQLAQQKQASQDPAAINRQLETVQNHYIDLLKAQADNKNAQAALQKDQQLAASQNAAHDRRIYELSKQAQDQEAKVNTLLNQQQQLQTKVDQQQAAAQEAKDKLTQIQKVRTDQQRTYQDEMATYQRARARYETLSELNEDYAGFYNGVRVVLKHKASLPGVIGAVAELLEVPSAYQQAFDLALGSNLQAIVTRDEAAAQRAISLLKQQRAGRATFLPAAVMRPRELPSAVLQLVESADGFLGTGLQLAQYPADLKAVMANLLGSVLIVDTLPHAIVIANSTHHRYRIVTTAGDILNPGGSLTGGQVKQGRQASPLARNQEARHLKTQLQDLVADLKQKQADLTTLTKQENAAQEAWQTATAQAQALAADLTAITSQHNAQAETLRQAQRQLAAAQQANTAQADLSTKLADLHQAGQKIAKEIADAQAKIDQLKEAAVAAADSSSKQAAAVNGLKTKLAVIANDLQTLHDQQQQWQAQAIDAQTQSTEFQQRIAHITATAKETAAEKESRTATIASLKKELTQLKADQTKLTQEKAANRGKLSDISARITTTYDQQHQAMATSEQQAVALNRVKLGLDSRLNTLAEDYQLTYEAAQAAVAADHAPIPELKSKLKLLKR